MIPFIKQQLNPNRLAVYLTALAALATALVTVLGDLDFQSTAGLLGSVALLAGVVAKWLTGWQQYEKAVYQRQLIEAEASAQQQAINAQAEAAAQVGGRRSTPKVSLPR